MIASTAVTAFRARRPGDLGKTHGFADRPHDRGAFVEGMRDNGNDRARVRRSS